MAQVADRTHQIVSMILILQQLGPLIFLPFRREFVQDMLTNTDGRNEPR
jgi:hypothetical protein